jgi:putative transposase
VANEELLGEIRVIHERSRRTCGAPRVWGQLRHRGHRVGRHCGARLMAKNALTGVHGRKKWRRGSANRAWTPELLNREFSVDALDHRGVAGLSEFHCLDGKLFVAGIRDLFDKTLVDWSLGERRTTDLVVSAPVIALSRRTKSRDLVHPSDNRSPTQTQTAFS